MRSSTVRTRISSTFALAALLAATLGAHAVPAAAIPGRWTRIGPEGGAVLALAAAPSRPSTLYAGLSVGGVFRSTDAGLTWSFAGSGLGRLTQVAALAVDAARPLTVYAATNSGLSRSTDGGNSWVPLRLPGDGAHSGTAVVADLHRPGTVYAAVFGFGLLASTDAGGTWRRLTGGPADTTLALAIDPASSATLYAGTVSQGVWKSTDAGAHWRAINRGLGSILPQVAAVAIDPRNPRTLLLAQSYGSLFRSLDGGEHWTRSDEGLGTPRFFTGVAVDPASSSAVFAASGGVFRSSDGGRTWRQGAGLPDDSASTLLATRRGLYVGTLAGVSTSHDRALSWQTGRGLSAAQIRSLAIDGQDPPRLYAFDVDRLFKSANRGASWLRLQVPTSPDDFPPVGPVVVDPHDPLRVDLGFIGSVFRSENGGRRWSQLFGVGCVYPARIVPDPSDSEVVYASGGFAIGACGLQPGACGSYKYDHGQTACLRDPAISRTGVTVIAIDPAAPHRLFTSSAAGLYQSLDAGASWSLLSSAVQPYLLAFDPAHPRTIYSPVLPGGVARSTDGGMTWQTATAGLPVGSVILSLVIDPALPSTLYASTETAVYGSTDSGATWEQLGTGLEDVSVSRLAIDPIDPSILYAGTLGGGVMVFHVAD